MRRLVERGHRARALVDDASRADFEAAGAEFRPWTEAYNRPDRSKETDPLDDPTTPDLDGGLPRALDRLIIGPAAGHAADTLAELRRSPADAAVVFDVVFGVADRRFAPRGAKIINFSTNLSAFSPVPGLPPPGPGFLPAASARPSASTPASESGETCCRPPTT